MITIPLEHLVFDNLSGAVMEDALLESDSDEGYEVVRQMTSLLYNAIVGQRSRGGAAEPFGLRDHPYRAKALGATP